MTTAVRADTLLHLAETATVMASPDEIAGTLRAEVTGPSAADAQAQVNALVRDALDRAHTVTQVVVSTGGYGVWRIGPTQNDATERWQVSQSVSLTSHDGPALLKLVGDLQQLGLAVSSLAWRLSREAEHKAHQAATQQALAALRGRAETVAGLLELRFGQFKDVRLDSAMPNGFLPRLAAPMAMSAMQAAPPPTAVAEDVPVNATAEADVILMPK